MVVTTRVKIAMIVTIQMKIAIFSVDRSTRRFTSVGWRRRERASPRTWSAPLRSHARVGCSIPAPVFFLTALIHTPASGAPPTSVTFASVSLPVPSSSCSSVSSTLSGTVPTC